jgi:spore germination cell wall hydrolase CwlJ-like protein
VRQANAPALHKRESLALRASLFPRLAPFVLAAGLVACAPHGRSHGGAQPQAQAARAPAATPIRSAAVDAAMRRAADPSLAAVSPETAEQINAERPFADARIAPMRPFVLKSDAADRERAVQCLAQAVYYEAAREPRRGQEAVAQVVLNRVRHPAYPKSVCGVVYQGAARATGCQFTFTCDGALRWKPEPALWGEAEGVARRALDGYVDKDVGSATHYHAAYVAPYWAPTLVKMTQVGQHIFYRWTGAWGEPAAFTGRYAGGERMLSPAVLNAAPLKASEPPPLREVALPGAGAVRTYKVADAAAPGGERTRVAGVILPSRRRPSADEVQRINDSLAAMEKSLDAKSATATAAAAPTAPPAG